MSVDKNRKRAKLWILTARRILKIFVGTRWYDRSGCHDPAVRIYF